MKTSSPYIDLDVVREAIELDLDIGFCRCCGETAYNVEPDARGYRCNECGEDEVYGLEELLPIEARK